MTEVEDFAQIDLDEEDVMLLDTWEEVRGQRAYAIFCSILGTEVYNLRLLRLLLSLRPLRFSSGLDAWLINMRPRRRGTAHRNT